MTRTWMRWAPAAGAVLVVTAAAIAVPMAANASTALPAKTPKQVISLVASSKTQAFTASVDQTSDLGLPSLPSTGSGSDASAASTLELLTGSHTAKVFVDGATKQRIQVLDSLAERDVIRNGTDLWIYNSKGQKVEHAVITPGQRGIPSGTAAVETPGQLATGLLAKLGLSSTITVGADVRVAGRTAYDLVLRPKAKDTLFGSISIAVDSETGLPLRVDVNARGQKNPAVEVAVSDLKLGAPAASVFEFTPPAGSTVIQLMKPARTGPVPQIGGSQDATPSPQKSGVTKSVTGTGWDAVVTVSNTGDLSKVTSSPLYRELTTAVPGGRLFHTSLVNVLLTSDGRILVGSVPVARLQAVAAQ
jgi:outer membrane lipoprotein-sorting protein